MNSNLFFFSMLCFISVALCAQVSYPKPKGKPGDCWTDYTGPMQEGEERAQIENECIKVACYGSIAEVQMCGYYKGENLKTTAIDYSKPYPECCPKPIGNITSIRGIL